MKKKLDNTNKENKNKPTQNGVQGINSSSLSEAL
jgi:hypothetical protein